METNMETNNDIPNNNYIIPNKITDFTNWGYGIISKEEIKYQYIKDNYVLYRDKNLNCMIIHRGLWGWGDTPVDAYMKAKKVAKSHHPKKDRYSKWFLEYSIKNLLFYRISPRAKDYLNTYGYYEDNRGYTDLYLIKVPFTVDNHGYPVTYIIDLVDDETKEKMNIPALKTINYRHGDSKKFWNKYGTLIKHEIKPAKHSMMKVKNIKTNDIKNNIECQPYNELINEWYNYGLYINDDKVTIIYGLGSTPEKAFQDAINYFNYNYRDCVYNNLIDDFKKNLELFFKIIPLSTNAKKYIKTFGCEREKYSTLKIERYQFNSDLVKIPPVVLENGYPTEYVIDLIDKKARAIVNLL